MMQSWISKVFMVFILMLIFSSFNEIPEDSIKNHGDCNSDDIYSSEDVLDEWPSPKGGMRGLFVYFYKSLNYPKSAKENQIEEFMCNL